MADAVAAIEVRPLTREAIDVAGFMAQLPHASDGAVVTFAGVVRDNQDGRRVGHLEYEAHETMAEAQIRKLASTAAERWGLSTVCVQHRLGPMAIGEVAVFVGVAAPHRGEAFDACRWLIDTLKAEVPIFKKEFYVDGGTTWVGEPGPVDQGTQE